MVQQRLRDLASTVCSVCSVFGVHEPVVSKNVSGVRWRCQRFFSRFPRDGIESIALRNGITIDMESPWNPSISQKLIQKAAPDSHESIIQDNPRFEMHVPSGNALCVSTPQKNNACLVTLRQQNVHRIFFKMPSMAPRFATRIPFHKKLFTVYTENIT